MVTAQGEINDWKTQNPEYIPESGDLSTGDRLKINCDTAGQRRPGEEARTGVIIDQDKHTYAVAWDVEGLVKTYPKKLTYRDWSRPEEACLVKKGILWKPGDWFYIIAGIEWNPSTQREERLDGQIGRLEQYNWRKRGFEVKLSELREPHVIKGAYLVKLSDSSTDKPTCDQEGVLESCHWLPAPAAPPPPPLVPPAPPAPAAPTGPDVGDRVITRCHRRPGLVGLVIGMYDDYAWVELLGFGDIERFSQGCLVKKYAFQRGDRVKNTCRGPRFLWSGVVVNWWNKAFYVAFDKDEDNWLRRVTEVSSSCLEEDPSHRRLSEQTDVQV
jgi:hypothetical protein